MTLNVLFIVNCKGINAKTNLRSVTEKRPASLTVGDSSHLISDWLRRAETVLAS